MQVPLEEYSHEIDELQPGHLEVVSHVDGILFSNEHLTVPVVDRNPAVPRPEAPEASPVVHMTVLGQEPRRIAAWARYENVGHGTSIPRSEQ